MNLRSLLGRAPAGSVDMPAAGTIRLDVWARRGALTFVAAGVVCWAVGAGLVAMWLFALAAAALGAFLPFPYAVVSPLFMGVAGWLVDMLPLVVLAGWAGVVGGWLVRLIRQRRWPRGGRWVWLPVGLAAWTAVGVTAIDLSEIKHFLLLFGIQVLASGVIVAVVDQLGELEARATVVSGLLSFVILLSIAVFLQWMGLPISSLQDESVSARAEAAYGVDAFPNDVGMLKYVRAKNAGAYEVRQKLEKLASASPGLPQREVFTPLSNAFGGGNLLIKFTGSARGFAPELERRDVHLVYDNLGVAPAQTVPRLRSFPRNPLSYAGISAALLPFAFFLIWSGEERRKRLGYVGAAACLFGAGFALARGAWAVIVIGGLYLLIDGRLSWLRKGQVFAAILAGAIALTAVFLIKYDSDPLTVRAGGEGSIRTREQLYSDTVESVSGRNLITGYGTTRSRSSTASTNYGRLGKYIPRAGTHSTYLNYLFRTGIPGALGIIAIFALAAAHARAGSRVFKGRSQLFSTLAAAAVVSVSAHALILSYYVEPIYTFTISLLMGLAMAGASNLPSSILPWRTRATT